MVQKPSADEGAIQKMNMFLLYSIARARHDCTQSLPSMSDATCSDMQLVKPKTYDKHLQKWQEMQALQGCWCRSLQ